MDPHKPCKAIFLECSAPHWAMMLKEFKTSWPGFEAVYWTGLGRYEADLKEVCPGLLFHEGLAAKRGLPLIPDSELPAVTFDAINRDVWEKEAQIVFDMLTRPDICKDLSYYERTRYFSRVLLYWAAVLEKLQPDLVVFPNSPHMVYDYVVYALCKRKNIPMVMFEYTGIPQFSWAMADFAEGSPDIQQEFQKLLAEDDGLSDIPLSPNMTKFWDKFGMNYKNALNDYQKNALKSHQEYKQNNFWKRDFPHLKNVFLREVQQYLRKETPNPNTWFTSLFKQRGKTLEDSFKGYFAQTAYNLQLLASQREILAHREFYQTLVQPFDSNIPYVYASLSAQPERSTNPQGGIFTNPVIFVQYLSALLPTGWTLYVKEHPNHFMPHLYRSQCRENSMYVEMAKLPNVKLLDIETDPFDLIEYCQTVATVSGTIGWEATMRGKPVLCLGSARYRFGHGIFDASTTEGCLAAFAEIQAGFKIDKRKTRLFLKTLENVCFEGISDPVLPWFTITEEENAKNLANALQKQFWMQPSSEQPVLLH